MPRYAATLFHDAVHDSFSILMHWKYYFCLMTHYDDFRCHYWQPVFVREPLFSYVNMMIDTPNNDTPHITIFYFRHSRAFELNIAAIDAEPPSNRGFSYITADATHDACHHWETLIRFLVVAISRVITHHHAAFHCISSHIGRRLIRHGFQKAIFATL